MPQKSSPVAGQAGATVVYTIPPPCRAPITRQNLHCLIRVTHRYSHLRWQDRIILVIVFCTAFHGFLRVSEFTSPLPASFDPSRHTSLKDLHQYTHHFKLNLKWTKTDKSRRGHTVRKMSSFDSFWLPQFHTFPHHWTVSLAKHSPMTFTNVLENLIIVWNLKQAVGLHCI